VSTELKEKFSHQLYCTTFPLRPFENLTGSKEIAIMPIFLMRGVEQVVHTQSFSLIPGTVKISKDPISTKYGNFTILKLIV
jgi:hypothetical protein